MEDELLFKVEIPRESITSIENLTKANKELRLERKKLDLQSDEGKKRAQQINAQLDANTEIIKKNSSALEKQRLNVGNYSSALDKVAPGLSGFANGIQSSTKAALAFIATPLGAIIGAIGVAVAALTAHFKNSEEGQNDLVKVTRVFSVILGNLSDILADVGKNLFDAFTNPKQALSDLATFVKQNLINRFTAFKVILDGIVNLDFEQVSNGVIQAGTGIENAIGKATESVKGLVAETEKEIEQANRLSDLQAKTDLLERDLLVKRSQIERDIADRRLKARQDDKFSAEERIQFLNEAQVLQDDLLEQDLQVAQNRLKLREIENSFSKSTKENLNEEARLRAALGDIEAKRLDEQRALEREFQRVNGEIQKGIELQSNSEREARIRSLEHTQEIEAQKEAILKTSFDKAIKRTEQELKSSIKANEKKLEDEKKATQLEFLLGQQRLDNSQRLVAAGTELAKEGSQAQKTLAIAEATISTYAGAAAAIREPPIGLGPVFGPILAAITIATGLARVSKIASISGFFDGGLTGFAQGGLSGTKIEPHHGTPIRRRNGDNLLATVKTGEVILNERHQAMLGGDATFRTIGVPGFASSGATSFSVANAARQSEARTQREIDTPVIVTVEDINAAFERVDNINRKAQVV